MHRAHGLPFIERVLVGNLRCLRGKHRRQAQRHRQPEKLTGHTTSSIIVISGPCLGGRLSRSGHSRASRRPRARLRAISLRQADTDWLVVAPNRAAVRQGGANVSATTPSASPRSTGIPETSAQLLFPYSLVR